MTFPYLFIFLVSMSKCADVFFKIARNISSCKPVDYNLDLDAIRTENWESMLTFRGLCDESGF